MVKEIIWTPQAQITFRKVVDYLEFNWTQKEVERFVILTDIAITYISNNPKMFRATDKLNIREAMITPHNLLVYRIYKTRIYLIAFWDTRQNPKKRKY